MNDSRIDTLEHINTVKMLIETKIIQELQNRAEMHDMTKLEEPEKSIFDEYTPKLKNTTFGSAEYKSYLAEMKKALDHHYENNRHHPEHYENGINGMNLIDLCEMITDWKAASLRHADGDILKSIEINQKRFGYGDELKQILLNTVKEYF